MRKQFYIKLIAQGYLNEAAHINEKNIKDLNAFNAENEGGE